MHPLEVTVPKGADDRKYEKPRFPQFSAPARIIITGKSGSGKSLAAMTLIDKVYFDMCDRIILVSGSLKLDPSYEPLMKRIRAKYQAESIDMRDPQENPFHEDLSGLDDILAGMVKRTKEAEHLGAKEYPLSLVFIDDLMVGSGKPEVTDIIQA